MLIAIEGIDGVGKTTLAKALAEKIGALYLKFPDRRTQTGVVLDQALRSDNGFGQLGPVTFQALQCTNRLEKWHQLAAAAGSPTIHVVADRYVASGYVYGKLDGLAPSWLDTVFAPFPTADLQVLLVADVAKVDGERLAGRDREVYERKGLAGLRAQHEAFTQLWELKGRTEGSNIWRVFTVQHEGASALVTDCLAGIVHAVEAANG